MTSTKGSDWRPDLVVVGSGFFGAVIAHKAAVEANAQVLLIEKRSHIGGNSYSYTDPDTNIEIHKYGTHLFHTSNERVWKFVNQFCQFNDYRHTVWTTWQNQVLSMPINLDTICQVFGRALSPSEAREAIAHDITNWEHQGAGENLESKAISLIGPTLYRAVIEGYTRKQWQTDPADLPSEIITRLPVRFDFNNRYFNDTYEGLPLEGYGELFRKMLDLPNIKIQLETDFFKTEWSNEKLVPTVYSGPIDRYFNYVEGRLSWRTLDFEWDRLELNDAQGCAVMNYADVEVPHTRVHEFRHLHPERAVSEGNTIIAREYSRWAGPGDEPYYPVNSPNDREMLGKYRNLAAAEKNVVFGGRLGSYQYLDMHMSIASALTTWETQVEPLLV